MRSTSTAARGAIAFLLCSTALVLAATSVRAEHPDPAGDTTPTDLVGEGATAGDADSPGDDPAGEGDAVPGEGGDATDATTDIPADDVPVRLRLRRLEQRVQALKERAWRAKARVGMLKEAVLGGGIGASATIVHSNKMGGSFRLIKLIYALDGTQIFARGDNSLHSKKSIDILTGPVAPGSHTISVYALYRGHGYGVFKYLNKYRFKVRSSHTFTATEGKAARIEVIGFERGGITTPLEKRPAIDFKVSSGTGTLK